MARKKAAKKAATRRIAKKETVDVFAWNDPVAAIDATLQTLENQVAQGDVATPGLEALKSALDELRLRAWGLLMATNADDPQGFQQRFRIRRGKDMCRALCGDLHVGKLSGRHPDLPELGAAAQDLAAMVDDARRRAS
jgi:hypothetical protein